MGRAELSWGLTVAATAGAGTVGVVTAEVEPAEVERVVGAQEVVEAEEVEMWSEARSEGVAVAWMAGAHVDKATEAVAAYMEAGKVGRQVEVAVRQVRPQAELAAVLGLVQKVVEARAVAATNGVAPAVGVMRAAQTAMVAVGGVVRAEEG